MPVDSTRAIAGFVADLAPAIGPVPQLSETVEGQILPPLRSADRTLTLFVFRRDGTGPQPTTDERRRQQVWVLGSSCDVESSQDLTQVLGNGVTVHYDSEARSVVVQTSIAGLPAVFVYETAGRVVLASDLWLLRRWVGEPFRFDPIGLQEFLSIGHPVGFRTLFESVHVIAGGTRATLNVDNGFSVCSAWKMPETTAFTTSKEYVGYQREAFLVALGRIQKHATFLSLTAGIDSRTVLAGLMKLGQRLPVRTMSWKNSTLDARIASELCSHYGLSHETVTFDETFAKRLPDLAAKASRLSGGLASVSQATEVAFYSNGADHWNARLSGYLGNQVARGGVEAVSLRGCDLRVLSHEFRKSIATQEGPQPQGNNDIPSYGFVQLLNNATLASIGNYCIGHHFATQESPYASRELIEAAGRRPPLVGFEIPHSTMRIRLRDLAHRFAGEPIGDSFQRLMLCEVGGFIAECPVNWGWRPRGGWSMKGLLAGALSFTDAATSSMGLDDGRFSQMLAPLGITGRHNFSQVRRWCTREYLYDTLTQSRLRQGVLSTSFVEAALARHFKGDRAAFGIIQAALDLAYADLLFTQYQADPDYRALSYEPDRYSANVARSANV